MKRFSVLVIGGGAREHALYQTVCSSPLVDRVYVAPGNAGIPPSRRYKLDLKTTGEALLSAIVELARGVKADLVVIGPEQANVDGVVDFFAKHEPNIRVFGPRQMQAKLEGSKIYFKDVCTLLKLPTAPYEIAENEREALGAMASHMRKYDEPPVIKADGLCAGKGVVVADSAEEAGQTAVDFIVNRIHGDAGKRIVIEKRLKGEECSFMCLCDGVSVIPLLPSRDYKRVSPKPGAPNTGGMGAYAPLPDVSLGGPDYTLMFNYVERLVQETGYRGLLYAGFMLTEEGPMFLEVNCRFGDPETQVVLPLLESDLLPLLWASCEHDGFTRQKVEPPRWKDAYAVGVVVASEGYPGKYSTGFPVTGIEDALKHDSVRVFEAGTELKDGVKVTSGGRVLTVVGISAHLQLANSWAYVGANHIRFQGAFFREDIAEHAWENKKTAAG